MHSWFHIQVCGTHLFLAQVKKPRFHDCFVHHHPWTEPRCSWCVIIALPSRQSLSTSASSFSGANFPNSARTLPTAASSDVGVSGSQPAGDGELASFGSRGPSLGREVSAKQRDRVSDWLWGESCPPNKLTSLSFCWCPEGIAEPWDTSTAAGQQKRNSESQLPSCFSRGSTAAKRCLKSSNFHVPHQVSCSSLCRGRWIW